MAERVQRPLGQADIVIGDGENDARGSQGDKPFARRDGADAHRRGGIVARAARDRNSSPAEAPGGGVFRRKKRRNFGALDEPRHLRDARAGRGEQIVVPAPARDVEPERARRVGHFRDRFACQPEPRKVLRQENAPRRLEDVGFMLGHPERLGRGEAGHRQIARAMAEIGNPPLELDALREGAPVVPENRGTQHPILRIEKSRAMHLARETDSREAGESVAARGGGPPRRRPRRLRSSLRGSARSRAGAAAKSPSRPRPPRRRADRRRSAAP